MVARGLEGRNKGEERRPERYLGPENGSRRFKIGGKRE
jgi:hypothetical protein